VFHQFLSPHRDTSVQEERVMNTYETMNVEGGRHVKLWTRGVPVEEAAKLQLANTARMPFIFKHVAAMPDVHLGIGATVGSVAG
jgi:tRNA-splicing ligase RtcB (3'-phosphate/5'-hydroxy nucleic acid ligase)